MVSDLLEFNRFAGNAVAVVKETRDLPALVGEIAERWRESARIAPPWAAARVRIVSFSIMSRISRARRAGVARRTGRCRPTPRRSIC
jgi:hypothetical protein